MIEEYLSLEEVSARLKLKPKTVKNKMAAGVFRKGIHATVRRMVKIEGEWVQNRFPIYGPKVLNGVDEGESLG